MRILIGRTIKILQESRWSRLMVALLPKPLKNLTAIVTIRNGQPPFFFFFFFFFCNLDAGRKAKTRYLVDIQLTCFWVFRNLEKASDQL